jgi:hypothetical protein
MCVPCCTRCLDGVAIINIGFSRSFRGWQQYSLTRYGALAHSAATIRLSSAVFSDTTMQGPGAGELPDLPSGAGCHELHEQHRSNTAVWEWLSTADLPGCPACELDRACSKSPRLGFLSPPVGFPVESFHVRGCSLSMSAEHRHAESALKRCSERLRAGSRMRRREATAASLLELSNAPESWLRLAIQHLQLERDRQDLKGIRGVSQARMMQQVMERPAAQAVLQTLRACNKTSQSTFLATDVPGRSTKVTYSQFLSCACRALRPINDAQIVAMHTHTCDELEDLARAHADSLWAASELAARLD